MLARGDRGQRDARAGLGIAGGVDDDVDMGRAADQIERGRGGDAALAPAGIEPGLVGDSVDIALASGKRGSLGDAIRQDRLGDYTNRVSVIP